MGKFPAGRRRIPATESQEPVSGNPVPHHRYCILLKYSPPPIHTDRTKCTLNISMVFLQSDFGLRVCFLVTKMSFAQVGLIFWPTSIIYFAFSIFQSNHGLLLSIQLCPIKALFPVNKSEIFYTCVHILIIVFTKQFLLSKKGSSMFFFWYLLENYLVIIDLNTVYIMCRIHTNRCAHVSG